MRPIFIFLFIFFVFAACKTPLPNTVADIKQVASCVVSLRSEQQPMEYLIAVQNNRVIYYDERAFVPVNGKSRGSFKQQIDKKTYENLIKTLQKAGVTRNKIVTLSSLTNAKVEVYDVTLVLPDVKPIDKQLSNAEEKGIIEAFEKIRNLKNWLPRDDTKQLNDTPQDIDNELIVQLKSEINATEWVKKYAANNLKLKKRLSPDLNYWKMSFDKNGKSGNYFLISIQEDAAVVNAQFNRRIQLRK